MKDTVCSGMRRLGCALAMVSCVMSGCVELKYTALDRLNDPVAISVPAAPSSVYFDFPSIRQRDRAYAESFASAFADAAQRKGFSVAATPGAADIVMHGRVSFYSKSSGSFLFILILPIYRFNEEYDGISMNVSFATGRGKWRKTYRAYYRGWLEGDIEIASDRILDALLADLPRPASPDEKSQNKAENGPLH